MPSQLASSGLKTIKTRGATDLWDDLCAKSTGKQWFEDNQDEGSY